MNLRINRAIGVIFLGIGLLTGCLFDSRKTHEDPLRYVSLGNPTRIRMEMDFAPSKADAGLFLTWTSSGSSSVIANWLEGAFLDTAGEFEGSSELTDNETYYLTSPRISAFRMRGSVRAWIRNFRGETANEVHIQLTSESYSGSERQSPTFIGLRTAHFVTALGLPDNGFLLGVEGINDSGSEGLWVQRFDPVAKPKGDPWLLPVPPISSAPELVLKQDGGWTAIWRQSEADRGLIAWLRFDSDGKPVGETRSRPLPGGSSFETTLRAVPLPGGRILIQARYGKFAPFVIGADGEPENDWADAGDWQGAPIAADTLRHRLYAFREGKLLRLDSAFQVQATQALPALLASPPALAILPSGKIALIGKGDGRRPIRDQNSLLVYTVDPF